MSGGLTRRRALRTAGALALGTVVAPGRGSARSRGRQFDPTRHGFGFRNWGTETQYFEIPPDPEPATVRNRVREGWRSRATAALGVDTTELPHAVTDAIARQIRTAIVQRAGTNGHCYGMSLAARAYFRRPESIPVDRAEASDIEHPTIPFDRPEAPVYEEIVARQADQFFRFRAWLARLAVLAPSWVDQAAVLRDVQTVVETTGAASVVLFDGSLSVHQVVAHRVEPTADGIRVHVYDPNRRASTYANREAMLQFRSDGDRLSMEPYDNYTGLLYTQYDQIERATERERTGPIDHFRVDRGTVLDSLFPLVQVAVDSDELTLAVTGPADCPPVDRIRGRAMDRSRGAFPRLRTCYGAVTGTYRIRLFADGDADYELRTTVADREATRLDAVRTGRATAGDLHEYELIVAKDGVTRVRRPAENRRSTALVGALGGAAGVAVGAGAAIAAGRARRSGREE